jgi:hypothetical protein
MDIQPAKEIVLALANGINPITGEPFPDDSPYNHPSIIRALYTIFISSNVNHPQSPNQKTLQKQVDNLKNGKPRNAGLPWTAEMKLQLKSSYKKGITIEQLAEIFERTEGAIRSELEHQGLITQSEE